MARSAYVGVLLALMVTAWAVVTGTQVVRDVGDLARFGTTLFQIFAPLQLVVALFCSAMLAASAVAQEKDRKTLVLLLLTNMTNSELVLGKLLAALLNVLVLLAAAFPLFMLTVLFGGVSPLQVVRVFAVTLVSILVCGSLGSAIALWREKTFQAIAMTVLVLALWLAAWEVVGWGLPWDAWWGIPAGDIARAMSPWRAIQAAARPFVAGSTTWLGATLGAFGGLEWFLLAWGSLILLINGVAVAMVRVWNPSRETRVGTRQDDAWRSKTVDESADQATAKRSRTRRVWDNPIIWREIRTWAYGRKVLVIRLAYLVLAALAAVGLHWMLASGEPLSMGRAALALVPLFLLSLVLVNAQAVTSLTSERDGKALDLLLVSDLTPKEFVFGKLGGVFYNTKEMVVAPFALCGYLWIHEAISSMNLCFLTGGLAVLYVFVATVGVHAGMNHFNSRHAIGVSLGTVFFLSVGIATCMWIMLSFSGSFEAQFTPFFAFMIGGGAGLYAALGSRNPSTAIFLASFLCPVATFYAITSLFLGLTHFVFLATVAAYGFTTIAMLIPAIDEFDVATGRTTADEG